MFSRQLSELAVWTVVGGDFGLVGPGGGRTLRGRQRRGLVGRRLGLGPLYHLTATAQFLLQLAGRHDDACAIVTQSRDRDDDVTDDEKINQVEVPFRQNPWPNSTTHSYLQPAACAL